LSKVAGEGIAKRVARELRYPNFNFSKDPVVAPYTVGPADAIIVANLAFRAPRQQVGVALYDGVGETDLTGLYDVYAASAAANLLAVAASPSTIRSAHGLILLPLLAAAASEVDGAAIRHLDRVVVAGRNGAKDGAGVVAALRSLTPALQPTYVHSEADQRFSLEPVIEDLARTVDLPTARFALRRLEFRSETIRLEGSAVAWGTLPLALGLAVLGASVSSLLATWFGGSMWSPPRSARSLAYGPTASRLHRRSEPKRSAREAR
jgi:hypothetical protein